MIGSRSIITIRSRLRAAGGFSLLELLLSMALLCVVMIIIASAINTMQNTWVRLREKSDEYRGARMALDGLTRHLQQATLATRWVPDLESTAASRGYKRESNLHYVSGPASELLQDGKTCGHAVFFQGPFGEPDNGRDASGGPPLPDHEQLSDTLSAWGYFVEFDSDSRERPPFLREAADRVPSRRRFRLMEFRQPAEDLSLFELDTGKSPPQPKLDFYSSRDNLYEWFRTPLQSGGSRVGTARSRYVAVLAENVLACIITPFDPALDEAEQYNIAEGTEYDTRRAQYEGMTPGPLKSFHKLPPALRLTVIMTSEDSWRRLDEGAVDTVANQLRTAVNVRFRYPERFDQDLESLEGEMNRIKMRYRIFTTNIRMSEQ